MYVADTIAAIATAPGPGSIGVVRVSGSQALAVAQQLLRAAVPPERWVPNRLYHGVIVDPAGRAADEALAVLMRAPRSYTGEDVLELHCHGSPVVLRHVLALALSCGVRLAEPGEFTRRAFVNGRLDLTQAEAVFDVVRARGTAAASMAVAQLTGSLSRELAEIRENLVQLKSLLEAQIDFAEEDFEIDPTSVRALVDAAEGAMQGLLRSYEAAKVVRDGLKVVIVGKPNVGKSSLLNALLADDRAIVTPHPGTTRDTIEETVEFAGIPVVLTDTAGLRPLENADPVERLGIARASSKLAEAEVCLVVLDVSAPLDADDESVLAFDTASPKIVVFNKIDLPRAAASDRISALRREYPTVEVSAKNGEGLDRVREAVLGVIGGAPREQPALANLRQHDALAKAVESLALARQSLDAGRPPDLIAIDVQDAIDHVGAITGAVTSEEILDRIFSQFCVGK
jgi:tRNA modification GTPase